MPIEIQAPDGSIARFPDGMSDDEITAIMGKEYGSAKVSQATAAPAPEPGRAERTTFLPLMVDEKGQGSLAVPGAIYKPFMAAKELLSPSGQYRPGSEDARAVENSFEAGSVAMPGAGVAGAARAGATREAYQAAKQADDAAAAALGPRTTPPTAVDKRIERFGQPDPVPPAPRAQPTPAPAARDELLQAAERQDTHVPAFVASDTALTKKVAGGMRGTPVIGDPIEASMLRMADDLGKRKEVLADRLSPSGTTPHAAGSIARDATTEWMTGKQPGSMSETMKQGYDALDSVIKKDTMVPLSRTRIAAGEMRADDIASATVDGQRIIKEVQEALKRPQGLSYDGLKTLRTRIGDKLSQSLEPGVSGKLLNRIYGSLTEDLRFAAGLAGKEKKGSSRALAIQTFDDATARAKTLFEQRGELARIVGEKGDATGAQVFERIVALAGSNSRGDVGRLALAKKAMGDAPWGEVASAKMRQMGLDKNDQFSPARFNTEYASKRLPDDAKLVLFGKDGKAALDDIHRLSLAWERAQGYGNASGTGRSVAVTGALYAAYLNPLNLLTSAAGGYALSSILARPVSAKQVARYMQAATQHAKNPSPSSAAILEQTTRAVAPVIAAESGKGEDEITQALRPTRTAEAAPEAPRVERFEDALKLRRGTRFIDPEGVERVR